MIQLRTLGAIDIAGDEGHRIGSVLQQPKRTALLVFLATAERAGMVSRDRVLAVFWPEADRERAGHALSQALYYLRRSLGNDVLANLGPEELGLDPAKISCDALTFQQALDRGDALRALECYQGEFLSGFHVSDLPDLERWIDRERSRLEELAADAASGLSHERHRAGDSAGAVQWAERALELAPFDEVRLRKLLRILDDAGDRGRAIRMYHDFSRNLQAELEVEPSDETQLLVHQIAETEGEPRVRSPQNLAASPVLPIAPRGAHAESSGPQPAPPESKATSSLALPQPPRRFHVRVPPPVMRRVRRHALSSLVVFGAIAGVLIAGVRVGIGTRGAVTEAPSATARVAVMPFTFHGSESHEYLAHAVTELLHIGLTGVDGLQTVDPRALIATLDPASSGPPDPRRAADISERFDAEYLISGSVLEAGGLVKITAYIYEMGELKGGLQQRLDDEIMLFDVVDDLVRRLIGAHFFPSRTHLERVAALTTHSLPALKAFIEGEREFRAGRFLAAIDAFQRAIADDSTFALAYYRMSVAALWTGLEDFDRPRSWAETALRHGDRLSQQNRLLIEALQAFLDGSLAQGERLYRTILAAQPENVEAWFQLGELYFHYGPLAGLPVGVSREPFERVLTQDPRHFESLMHLAAIAAAEGRTSDLFELVDGSGALVSEGELPLHLAALSGSARGQGTQRDRLVTRARRSPVRQIRTAISYLARFTGDLDAAEDLARVLLEPHQPDTIRAEGHISLAHLKMARGKVREAKAELDAARRLDPAEAIQTAALFSLLPFLPVELASVIRPVGPRDIASEATARGSRHVNLYLLGLSSARDGRMSIARERASELDRLARTSTDDFPVAGPLAHGVMAEIYLTERRFEDARAELERVTRTARMWYERARLSPLYSLARERYLRAELLLRMEKDEKALRWYESLPQSSLAEVVYLAPSMLRKAQILERAGKTAEANANYARFAELWRDADPEFRELILAPAGRVQPRAAADEPDQ